MNEREQLIAEALGDGGGGQFALVAAARARRRRALRRASLVTGLAAALIALLLAPRRSVPEIRVAAAAPATAPVLEILSDQELVAQLKDQSVLFLKGKSGITGVVFLRDKNAGGKL